MNPVDKAAFISVGRANSFVLLGIFCIAFGLMYQPPVATFVSGVLCLSQAIVLRGFARWSQTRPYHLTETWLIISEEDRPPKGFAQQVVSVALRSAYIWFSKQIVWYGGALLVISIALSASGVTYLDFGGDHVLYSDHYPAFLPPVDDPYLPGVSDKSMMLAYP